MLGQLCELCPMLDEIIAGYRNRARECRDKAGQATVPADRHRWKQIADDWDALAARAEEGGAMISEQPVAPIRRAANR
jgi:hypothetical protein